MLPTSNISRHDFNDTTEVASPDVIFCVERNCVEGNWFSSSVSGEKKWRSNYQRRDRASR